MYKTPSVMASFNVGNIVLLALIAFGCVGVVTANAHASLATTPRVVYQRSYDFFNNRDLAYSGKFVFGTNQYIMTGPTTTNTISGIDFFALSVNKFTGVPTAGFGINGLVIVDFDNVGGNSRTDVATELVMLSNPSRVLLLGESVVSQVAPSNLTFSIAALFTNNGALVPNFGNGGKAIYDIEEGINDEIFFGDSDANNDVIVGGFANPGQVSGAGPAFNCALLKINQYGIRDKNYGQNGQVIIDYSGWDDRCRAGLGMKNVGGILTGYTVGGRTKPSAPAATANDDQNNWRFATTAVDEKGSFVRTYTDGINGFGRSSLNMNNGSFDAIRSVEIAGMIYTLGNWGGWDNGVSGNKAAAITRWNSVKGVDLSYLAVVEPPVTGGSYDMYGLAHDGGLYLYAVGSIKTTAASASTPSAVVMRFLWSEQRLDTSFANGGIMMVPIMAGFVGSNARSVTMDGRNAINICGEVIKTAATNSAFDTWSARIDQL